MFRIRNPSMEMLAAVLFAVLAYWLPGPICAYLLYAIWTEVAT